MIGTDGSGPVAMQGIERIQERGSILGVAAGIEGFVQAGEGVGVMQQIDLHAPGIDGTDAFGLKLPHRRDGFLAGVEILAGAFGVDRPGPWPDHAGCRVQAAGFLFGYGSQKTRWKTTRILRARNRSLA